MSASRKNRGFTLVELIVVLVILVILAAILVPALLGYIDKAKKEKILLEAKDVWTASQAALAECYGLYPDSFEASCKFTSTIDGKTIKSWAEYQTELWEHCRKIQRIVQKPERPAG